MTAVSCRNAADRKGETWAEQLVPFTRLEFAVSDAAKGITKAVTQVAAARRDDPSAPALEHGLDVFHTAMGANGVLARSWRRAEAAWEHAEDADAKVAAAKLQGLDARGVAQTARAAWSKATASFGRVERLESAWGRAESALELFTPDGQLNDRPRAQAEIAAALEEAERLESAWGRAAAALESFDADGRLNDRVRAEAEIAGALKELTGPEWSKVRNFLTDPRSLSFLDRMHRRLESAEPRPQWREAMAWRWWLRHRRPRPSGPIAGWIQTVGRDRVLNAEEQASYDRVAAVLGDTVRASSAVECMNSVLRMQQSRHRRMTQPMLDLKRLYWNCRPFRSGPRKDACPYQTLGLNLPTYDFWELLHSDPARLTQELSTQGNVG